MGINGLVAFGYGLGDILYLAGLLAYYIVIFVLYFSIRKVNNVQFQVLLFGLMLLAVISVSLMLTFFRGPEYFWNGHLFTAI
jgi:membrane-associated HD superfamily phosphohydrolase